MMLLRLVGKRTGGGLAEKARGVSDATMPQRSLRAECTDVYFGDSSAVNADTFGMQPFQTGVAGRVSIPKAA